TRRNRSTEVRDPHLKGRCSPVAGISQPLLNFAGQFKFDANLDDDRQEKPRLLRSVNRGVLDRRNTRANKPLRGKTRQFSPSGTASKAAKFFGNLSLLPSRHSRSDWLSIA